MLVLVIEATDADDAQFRQHLLGMGQTQMHHTMTCLHAAPHKAPHQKLVQIKKQFRGLHVVAKLQNHLGTSATDDVMRILQAGRPEVLQMMIVPIEISLKLH